MPFPAPTGYAPNTVNPLQSNEAPPQFIQDVLAQVGTPWDPSRVAWDPYGMTLIDRSNGARYNYGNIPDPGLGTDVVTNLSNYNASGPSAEGTFHFDPGVNPYIAFPGEAYNAGLVPNSGIFLSADPNEIAEYSDARRDRDLQGIARVGAIVGGGAALGATGSGPLIGGGEAAAAGAGAGEAATTYPYVAGGTITGSAIPGVTSATTAANAAAAGILPAAGVAAGTGAATNALGSGAASAATDAAGSAVRYDMEGRIPSWVTDYLLPGVGAVAGASAAEHASEAEAAAYQAAIDEQRRQFDLTRADWAPWMEAGRNALTNLSDPAANFLASPGYEWLRSEGTRDIGNSFAARGGAASGNALRALAEYQTGLAQQDFGNWYNRELARAGLGTTGTSAVTSAGQNTSANVGNYLAGQGASRASGVLGKYAALGGGMEDVYRNFLTRRRAA